MRTTVNSPKACDKVISREIITAMIEHEMIAPPVGRIEPQRVDLIPCFQSGGVVWAALPNHKMPAVLATDRVAFIAQRGNAHNFEDFAFSLN